MTRLAVTGFAVARLGVARLGVARLGVARLGVARLGVARLGVARLGVARLGVAAVAVTVLAVTVLTGCGKTRAADDAQGPPRSQTAQVVTSSTNDPPRGSCVSPRGADRCANDGRVRCTGARPSCPPYESASVTLGWVTATYSGRLRRCESLPDPTDERGSSLEVRVEAVDEKAFPLEGARQLETWVHLARTDVSPPCGLVLNFRSLAERPRVKVGERWRVSSRTVQRPDQGVPGIQAVADEQGQLLYALVLSAPVRSFAEDLGEVVPGLRVNAIGDALCTDVGGASAFRLELSTDAESCGVDSQAHRCCTLWQRPYEVEALTVTSRAGNAAAEVGFALRARGFLRRAEPAHE